MGNNISKDIEHHVSSTKVEAVLQYLGQYKSTSMMKKLGLNNHSGNINSLAHRLISKVIND